jgi:hypothetical protein
MKGWTLLERPFDTLSVKLLAEAEITCQASVTAFPTDPAVALEGTFRTHTYQTTITNIISIT